MRLTGSVPEGFLKGTPLFDNIAIQNQSIYTFDKPGPVTHVIAQMEASFELWNNDGMVIHGYIPLTDDEMARINAVLKDVEKRIAGGDDIGDPVVLA